MPHKITRARDRSHALAGSARDRVHARAAAATRPPCAHPSTRRCHRRRLMTERRGHRVVVRLQAAVALELEGEPAGPSRRAKARRHDKLEDETNSAASASSLKRPAQAPRAESVSGHSSGQRCSRDPGSRQWWRAGRHHRGKRRREAGEKKRSPA